MENKCDCNQCDNWDNCEIKMVIHNPMTFECFRINFDNSVDFAVPTTYTINKGDKIGQLILLSHAGYLMPSEYTLDNERVGGFGSSGTK